MSKQNKDINININQQPKKNNNQGTKQRNKRSKKNRRTRRRMRSRRGMSYFNFSSQTARIMRREVWFQDAFTQNEQLQVVKRRFDVDQGPAWFKTMAGMYEKYKLVHARIFLKFGGSKMTKGIYLLTYNSNLAGINIDKTYEQLAAQKGSRQITAANQSGVININGSSVTGYSTTLATEGADPSYAFNVIIAGIPVEDVPYVVEVEYKVIFYNPTITE